MEAALKCNNTSCRASLTTRAVVTTCSHIFCLDCAETTGLSRSIEARRSCPACKSPLGNPDDAVTTVLQPSEDYKTSVLSGLDPTTIMECAGRALAFWAYQATQEINFHNHMVKNLTEKYGHLNTQLDRVINDANAQIQMLQGKVAGLIVDHKTMQQKNNELIDMYREKSRKAATTQQLYDTLKKRILMSQVQTAASDNVNQTLKSMAANPRPEAFSGTTTGRPDTLDRSGIHHGQRVSHALVNDDPIIEEMQPHQRHGSGSQVSMGREMPPPPPPRKLPDSHPMSRIPPTTPMHRTPLPGPGRTAAVRSQIPLSTTRPGVDSRHYRPPGDGLRSMGSSHAHHASAPTPRGYGFTAGMKVGSDGLWAR